MSEIDDLSNEDDGSEDKDDSDGHDDVVHPDSSSECSSKPNRLKPTFCGLKKTRSYYHWYRKTNTACHCFADDSKHKKLKFVAGMCGSHKRKAEINYKGDKVIWMCLECATKNKLR
jgi:hypothetical protein